MPIAITGGKYASAALSGVGTTTVTVTTTPFVSGDFSVTRLVGLWNSAGTTFKGMAWVRRYVSTSQLQLQTEFFNPITGAVVTQVTGDLILVSKNFVECVQAGLAVTNKVVAITTTTSITFGVDNNSMGCCFYDEDKEVQNAVTTLLSGGLTVFGKLEDYASGVTSSPCDWYLTGTTFTGGIRTSNGSANACFYGGTIDGNRANTYYIGGNIANTGGGVGGNTLLLQKVQNVFDFASPSAGATWGSQASRHVLRDCISITNATFAIMIRWGDGVVDGGTYKFPNNTAAPLSVFGSDVAGTLTISAPSGKRLIVLDPGASAISGNLPQLCRSDAAVAITANFTNLISSIWGFTISTTGAANNNGVNNFYFSDDYTNLQSASVGVVTLDADGSTVDSNASTGTTWRPSVLRRRWTGLTQTFVRGPWTYGFKKYGYAPVSGAIAASNYTINGGYTADNVVLGGAIVQSADAGVTLSLAAANALSTLANLSDLYDAIIAWSVASVTNAKYPSLAAYLVSKDGLILDLGSRKLTIDSTAGAALAVNTGTNLVTAKATALATSAKFTTIKSTDTITIASASSVDGITFDGSVTYNSSVTTLSNVTVTGTLTLPAGTYRLNNCTIGTIAGTGVTIRAVNTTITNAGSATVEYYSAISHTVKDGATPKSGAVVAYYDDTNANRTYDSSFSAGALTSNGSGVVTGFVRYRLGGTTYTGINAYCGLPGYNRFKVPKTLTGAAVSEDILIFADSYYGATPSTGTTINFSTSTITQAGAATTAGVYDYYIQQWFAAANLYRNQLLAGSGASLEIQSGATVTVSSGAITGSSLSVASGATLNVNGGTLGCGANVVGTLNAASPTVLTGAINMQGGTLDFAALTSYQMTGSFASGTVDLDSLSGGAVTLDLRTVSSLGAGLTVKNDSNTNVTVRIFPSQTAPTLNTTGPGTGTLTVDNGAEASAPNLLNDSYVRLYNVTQGHELDIDTVSGGSGYVFSVPIGTGAGLAQVGDVLRMDVGLYRTDGTIKLPVRASGTLGDSGLVFSDSQSTWTNLETIHDKGTAYQGPNITDFALDVPNIEVDFTVTTISGWKLATWLYYKICTSTDGIRNYFNSFTDLNLYNFEIDSSVVDLKIDNTGTPAVWIDAAWTRSDGATIVATTSGTIQFNNGLIQVGINGEPSDVWSHLLATGYSASEAMDILTAVAAGKVSGGPGSPVFRSIDDTRNVVTGVADSSGNRTTSTITASG